MTLIYPVLLLAILGVSACSPSPEFPTGDRGANAKPPAETSNTIVAGHKFEVIPRPSSVVKEGDWLHLVSNTDDRRAVDPMSVRRVGLDGWPQTFDNGKSYRIVVHARLAKNVLASEWVNLVEFHDKAQPSVGPFSIVVGRSKYDGKHYVRVWNTPKGGKANYVAQAPFMPDHSYTFVLTFQSPGWMYVDMDGKRFASIPTDFSYEGAKLYPQFRLYSNAFKGRMDAWIKVDGIVTPAERPKA